MRRYGPEDGFFEGFKAFRNSGCPPVNLVARLASRVTEAPEKEKKKRVTPRTVISTNPWGSSYIIDVSQTVY